MYDILELNKKLLPELREIAKEMKIKKIESLRKQDLIYQILDQQAIMIASRDVKSGEKDRDKNRDRNKEQQRVEKKDIKLAYKIVLALTKVLSEKLLTVNQLL